MPPTTFNLARLPRIEFSPGAISGLPALLRRYGTRALILTGGRSFRTGPHWARLTENLRHADIRWATAAIPGEPSPALIDDLVHAHRSSSFDCVVGIGGGSVLDAAKAVAGLLKPGNSVMDHLEGVGPELPYHGPATPFIAVPTTAGTGSEATKNAVLSLQGTHGFKKSFRDDALMAEWAIIDPELLATCPPDILAANGMDAFTQLLESLVSTRANPFTDALARSGLAHARDALLPWFLGHGDPAQHRASMAYAALLSGITLAHVGLGSVHGLASPLGAFFPIPHGVVCGTLVAEATRINLLALRQRAPDSPALSQYAEAGRILEQTPNLDDTAACAALLETLEAWTRTLSLPRLSAYGVNEADIPRIVANSRGASMKTNPILLTDDEIAQVVRARL